MSPTMLRRRGSRTTLAIFWANCRSCDHSVCKECNESSIWNWKTWCQRHRSSRTCSWAVCRSKNAKLKEPVSYLITAAFRNKFSIFNFHPTILPDNHLSLCLIFVNFIGARKCLWEFNDDSWKTEKKVVVFMKIPLQNRKRNVYLMNNFHVSCIIMRQCILEQPFYPPPPETPNLLMKCTSPC